MAKNEFEKKMSNFPGRSHDWSRYNSSTPSKATISGVPTVVPLVPVPSDNSRSPYYINKLPDRQVIKTKKIVMENPILRTGGEFRNGILHFIFFRNGER